MSLLSVACCCGKTFRAKAEHAGKRARFPACGGILVIQGSSPSASNASTGSATEHIIGAPPAKHAWIEMKKVGEVFAFSVGDEYGIFRVIWEFERFQYAIGITKWFSRRMPQSVPPDRSVEQISTVGITEFIPGDFGGVSAVAGRGPAIFLLSTHLLPADVRNIGVMETASAEKERVTKTFLRHDSGLTLH